VLHVLVFVLRERKREEGGWVRSYETSVAVVTAQRTAASEQQPTAERHLPRLAGIEEPEVRVDIEVAEQLTKAQGAAACRAEYLPGVTPSL
jgi:hypothetical protein